MNDMALSPIRRPAPAPATKKVAPPPPPRRDVETGPDAPTIPVEELDKKIAKSISRLAEEIAGYNEDIAALTTLKDAAVATLTALGKQHELGKVKGEGWLLMPPTGRTVLKKELLLENGVTVEQIEKSTVVEPGKNYSVRRMKEKVK